MSLLPGEPSSGLGVVESPSLLFDDAPTLLSAPSVLPPPPSASKRRKRRKRRASATAALGRARLTELALALLTVLAASWPFTADFAGLGQASVANGSTGLGGLAVPMVLTLAAGGLVVLATRRLWWLPSALLSLTAVLLSAAVWLFDDSGIPFLPGPNSAKGTWDGLVHGWAYLLSITLPADPSGAVAVTPVVLTGAAGVLAAMLVLRSTVALLPLLAPLLALLPALAFSAAAHPSTSGSTVALLVTMLSLAVSRTSRLAAESGVDGRPHPADGPAPAAADADDPTGSLLPTSGPAPSLRGGRAAFSVPVVVLLTAGAVGLAPLLGISDGSHRGDPRRWYHDTIEIDEQVTPLSTMKSQLARRPPVTLFSIRVQQPGDTTYKVDRVRTAVLTSFDGATWSSGATYRRADSVLPEGPDATGAPIVRQEVRLAGLPGPYLPAAGRAARIEGDLTIGVDEETGTLVTTEQNLTGLDYSLRSRAIPHGSRLGRITPATGPRVALELPSKPAWISDALARAGADGSASVPGAEGVAAQLRAIEAYLRARPYYLAAPSGHSYFRIKRMLLGEDGEDAGFAEQRASAFAVLARALGVPARVSVGYLLRKPGADGSYTVTTEDFSAWPEVNLDGLGWVAYDPTGANRTPPPMRPEKNAQPQGADNSQQKAPDTDIPPVLFDDPDPTATDPGPGSVWERLLRLLLWAGLTVLALAVAVVVGKGVRRRRRRRGPASSRILGAWHEVGDRLAEQGLRPSAAQTPAEAVADLADRVPEPALTAMHPLTEHVGHALYAPVEPHPSHADRAWELSRQACRELVRSRPPHARLIGTFDPRPLLPTTWRRSRVSPRQGDQR